MKKDIFVRLYLIFTVDEIARISVKESGQDLNVTVDVHGMKCVQAKRFINNIINLIRHAFKLIVIHGYNNGTAIKDMLAENFINNHVIGKYQDPDNLGITYMLLRS